MYSYIDRHYHKIDCSCDKCWRKRNGLRTNGKLGNNTKKAIKRRKKKARFVPKIDYFEYIESPQWIERKQHYYKTNTKQCRACGSYGNVDLHHIEYSSLGNEKDIDLVCLCRDCHKEFHANNKTSKNMRAKMLLYIKNKQSHLKELKKYIELLKTT